MTLGAWLLVCGVLTEAAARVCIVGAGIGGAATAAFLRELDPDVPIAVFERGGEIGGRIRTVKIKKPDLNVELGAAVFHDDNRYVVKFAHELGLKIESAGGVFWESTFEYRICLKCCFYNVWVTVITELAVILTATGFIMSKT